VTPTLASEPACTGTEADAAPAPAPTRPANPGRAGATKPTPRVRVEPRALAAIAPDTWDALAAANPWATPFARWAFHRAWWDAYGATAHEQTLVILDSDAPATAPPIAIVPLMHRHEVEPTDAATHTTMRHGQGAELTPVEPHAKAVFFGASYHADYATVLGAPANLPSVAEALVEWLATPAADAVHAAPWDVVDLRRLRCGDPAADALAAAFGRREMGAGWTLNVEREDVCPVVVLPSGADFDGYLATLDKKERHEIRRKVRRAEAAGEIRLEDSTDPVADLDAFVQLHQKRFGEEGLFPQTEGGAASRIFFRRLFELLGPDGTIRLTFLTIGGRRIATGVYFETADSYLYFNAGVDPDASDLSPGVVLTAQIAERALAAGKRRLDFLRGHEPYKYAWGAHDEPIQRLLVRRRDS
jgi:GNAT acetyltransferase-like protein